MGHFREGQDVFCDLKGSMGPNYMKSKYDILFDISDLTIEISSQKIEISRQFRVISIKKSGNYLKWYKNDQKRLICADWLFN